MSSTDLGFRRYQADFEAPLPCPCLNDIDYHQTEGPDVIWLSCSGGAAGDVFMCVESYVKHMDTGGEQFADGGPCEICSYCNDCGALLTRADVEARACTQCNWPIDKLCGSGEGTHRV